MRKAVISLTSIVTLLIVIWSVYNPRPTPAPETEPLPALRVAVMTRPPAVDVDEAWRDLLREWSAATDYPALVRLGRRADALVDRLAGADRGRRLAGLRDHAQRGRAGRHRRPRATGPRGDRQHRAGGLRRDVARVGDIPLHRHGAATRGCRVDEEREPPFAHSPVSAASSAANTAVRFAAAIGRPPTLPKPKVPRRSRSGGRAP